ncbi:unknown [Bacteroides sp. CAG:875]|nr:unknown [Bacteroides sp. CAG:875]
MNGLQIFRRHDVLVIYFQFDIAFLILYNIGPAAYLHAGSPVGRGILFVQTQIAFSGNRHAQSSVTEHFNTNQVTHRSLDLLFLDGIVYLAHLLEIQLAGQHHHIGKAGVKLQRFRIADVQLGRKMHLLSHLVTVSHHGHISCNDGTDAGFLGRIHNLTHQCNILVVNDGIDGQVTLHPVFLAHLGDFTQIFYSKSARRTRTHVQTLNAEIDGIGSGMKGSCQRLA